MKRIVSTTFVVGVLATTGLYAFGSPAQHPRTAPVPAPALALAQGAVAASPARPMLSRDRRSLLNDDPVPSGASSARHTPTKVRDGRRGTTIDDAKPGSSAGEPEPPTTPIVVDAEPSDDDFRRRDLPVFDLDRAQLPHKGAEPGEAAVTVLECAGFDCPYCQKANATVEQLLEDNPDVAFHWVHFPLDVHPGAMIKAIGGVAAAQQDKFWVYHDRILENPDVTSEAGVLEVAAALDLDLGRFTQTLRDPATEALVREQQETCSDSDVRGSPSFFVDGVLLVGARPLEDFQEMVDRARVAGAAPPP